MLDMKEINKEIKKLENCDMTTYNVCDKLATLYTVRAHYKNGAGASSENIMPVQNGMVQAPAAPSIPK